jgi:hypothetical protein
MRIHRARANERMLGRIGVESRERITRQNQLFFHGIGDRRIDRKRGHRALGRQRDLDSACFAPRDERTRSRIARRFELCHQGRRGARVG